MRRTEELPTGTVTFLFTDIEQSTLLLQRWGLRYVDALADHRRLLRDSIRENGGHEVDTQGDSFLVAFRRARDAVAAAVSAQTRLTTHVWPDEQPLRVRMAVHTGHPLPTDEGYVGVVLHRGARICDAGHGGQILLSESTRQQLQGALVGHGVLRDLGPHRLKDLTEPQHLYQVQVEGLPSTFPPLRTLGTPRTNLPAPATPLIGRDHELTRLVAVLQHNRLVTLTGPGGVGKTRFAIEAARTAVQEYADGVDLVSLASVTDPDLVEASIATALGVREGPGHPLHVSLCNHLRDRRALLVLDNFEQVVDAAPAVAALLADCPGPTILVTSREPLRVPGEQEYPVAPLAPHDAVTLFVQRAQAVRPDFDMTDDNAETIAEVCAHLDGLPLAIELAAARVKALPTSALLDRLGNRLHLLVGGGRGRPKRHQTIRSTIQWSHDLLPDSERRLLARLGVFVGGWDPTSAEAVCDPDGSLGVDVLDGVLSLVDKSLVTEVRDRDVDVRFGMLETIREYAVERLAEDPSATLVRDAHAAHFVALADGLYGTLQRTEGRHWVRRLEDEHGNLQAAMEHLRFRGSVDLALRISWGAFRAWIRNGRLAEGIVMTERALGDCAARDTLTYAYATLGLSELYRTSGDAARAYRLKEDVLPILWREASAMTGAVLSDLGALLEDQGDLQGARAYHDQALLLQEQSGEASRVAHALCGLARHFLWTGDFARARRAYQQVLTTGRREADDEFVFEPLIGLAAVALAVGSPVLARSHLNNALGLSLRMYDLSAALDALSELVALELGNGRPGRAAWALGAVEGISERTGLRPYLRDDRAEHHAALRRQLDPAERNRLLAEGRALSWEEAVACALSGEGRSEPDTAVTG